jgi:phosphate starvation-inducible PhoH-like protein
VSDDIVTQRVSAEGADMLTLAGVNDSNLVELARLCGVKVALRGDALSISGPSDMVERAMPVATKMVETSRQQMPLTTDDVLRLTLEAPDSGNGNGQPGERRIVLPGLRRVIQPKSPGQAEYLQQIGDNDIVIGIGPAGTGKTYLAVAMAVDALSRKRVRRIVLARPAVEAGENLGFLPGDLQAKVDPYLRPLYDALDDMMPVERVQKLLETRTIEIVILDEAQNATSAQMKMFLTRLGVNSKAVITGDTTQIDLPSTERSGLLEVERVLKGIDGIGFHYFTEADVIRHRLVREIVKAYARDGGAP